MIIVTHGCWTRKYALPVINDRRDTMDLPSWLVRRILPYLGMLELRANTNGEAGLEANGGERLSFWDLKLTDGYSGKDGEAATRKSKPGDQTRFVRRWPRISPLS